MDASHASSLLECPICLGVSYPPIYQCPNGHIVCCGCIKTITSCGVCRQEMPTVPIRSLISEKLAEHLLIKECLNAGKGCKAKINIEEIENHKKTCEFNSTKYCTLIDEGNYLGCDKYITKQEIISHMEKDHALEVVRGNAADIIQEIDKSTQSIFTKQFRPVTFSCLNESFFIISELVEHPLNNGQVSWKCVVAGHRHTAARFTVQLTLSNDLKNVELNWVGPIASCFNMDNNEVGCLSVPISTLQFLNQSKDKEKLQWTIRATITTLTPRVKSREQSDSLPKVKSNLFMLSKIKMVDTSELTVPQSVNANNGITPALTRTTSRDQNNEPNVQMPSASAQSTSVGNFSPISTYPVPRTIFARSTAAAATKVSTKYSKSTGNNKTLSKNVASGLSVMPAANVHTSDSQGASSSAVIPSTNPNNETSKSFGFQNSTLPTSLTFGQGTSFSPVKISSADHTDGQFTAFGPVNTPTTKDGQIALSDTTKASSVCRRQSRNTTRQKTRRVLKVPSTRFSDEQSAHTAVAELFGGVEPSASLIQSAATTDEVGESFRSLQTSFKFLGSLKTREKINKEIQPMIENQSSPDTVAECLPDEIQCIRCTLSNSSASLRCGLCRMRLSLKTEGS